MLHPEHNRRLNRRWIFDTNNWCDVNGSLTTDATASTLSYRKQVYSAFWLLIKGGGKNVNISDKLTEPCVIGSPLFSVDGVCFGANQKRCCLRSSLASRVVVILFAAGVSVVVWHRGSLLCPLQWPQTVWALASPLPSGALVPNYFKSSFLFRIKLHRIVSLYGVTD
jgi:hypothetical protein